MTRTWLRGLSYGFNRPGCLGWYVFLPDGRLLKRRDLKFEGLTLFAAAGAPLETQKRSLVWHLRRIDRELGCPETAPLICDPALAGDVRGGEDGVTGLRRAGVRAVVGDGQEFLGWLRVRHWLAAGPSGRPWLVLHPDCTFTLRALPTIIGDKKEPDKIDETSEVIAAAIETRIVLMSRPAPREDPRVRARPAPNTVGAFLAQARRDLRRGRRGTA